MKTGTIGRAAGTALVLVGLVAGCSGGPAVAAKDQPDTATANNAPAATPSPSAAPTPSGSAGSSSPATPAGETSTAAAEVVLQGTSWSGKDSDGDDYVYRFQPDGRVGITSPTGTFGDASDTWSQSGNQVTISTRGGYSTRIGTVEGDTITGTASNVRGHTWTWTAQRQ